jgi:hypothetical protein
MVSDVEVFILTELYLLLKNSKEAICFIYRDFSLLLHILSFMILNTVTL